MAETPIQLNIIYLKLISGAAISVICRPTPYSFIGNSDNKSTILPHLPVEIPYPIKCASHISYGNGGVGTIVGIKSQGQPVQAHSRVN